ncbi:hypothetical protein [Sorangium cellulosum]|uniref:hypothetical protein n=1 Tax=Sorangium cellulosum TaxID=56 RepID=UPI0003057FBE|nr:hypothetical protein [Sorangium cellulosum]
MIKVTKPVSVGAIEQTIDLPVNPYSGSWALNETKVFWVGKDESGFQSFRATGTFFVERTCIP